MRTYVQLLISHDFEGLRRRSMAYHEAGHMFSAVEAGIENTGLADLAGGAPRLQHQDPKVQASIDALPALVEAISMARDALTDSGLPLFGSWPLDLERVEVYLEFLRRCTRCCIRGGETNVQMLNDAGWVAVRAAKLHEDWWWVESMAEILIKGPPYGQEGPAVARTPC